jgi:hypothetical protein
MKYRSCPLRSPERTRNTLEKERRWNVNTEIIFLVEEDSASGFFARALGHPIFTEAETVEELKNNIRDAIRCHFDESELPRIIRLHFVKEEVIAL